MTVDEAIERLTAFSAQGKGDHVLYALDNEMAFRMDVVSFRVPGKMQSSTEYRGIEIMFGDE